jgi:hypothetical protein
MSYMSGMGSSALFSPEHIPAMQRQSIERLERRRLTERIVFGGALLAAATTPYVLMNMGRR